MRTKARQALTTVDVGTLEAINGGHPASYPHEHYVQPQTPLERDLARFPGCRVTPVRDAGGPVFTHRGEPVFHQPSRAACGYNDNLRNAVIRGRIQ